MAAQFLTPSSPADLNLAPKPLFALERLIAEHIGQGRYPGCQIAIARHGRLALVRSLGLARTEPERVQAADDTLFLMFSNTKVLTTAALWSLVEEGRVSFMDPVADHLPEFSARGKGGITLFQVATHQAGFPSCNVTRASWADHARMRAEVCDFSLDWTPGSRTQYHPRAAHLTIAMVIEAVTGQDYRQVIRERVIAPLGLERDIYVGVPAEEQHRCADTVMASSTTPDGADNSAEFRAAGLPHGGGYGTARGMAAFYQMLAGGGRLGATRLFSPRTIAYVTRDFTGDMPDAYMDNIPMHRGLGPHVRGLNERVRGLGSIASPRTFGHGGVGSSYCWADPDSGVSFAYLTNQVVPEPWHTLRMDRVSTLVHAAID